MELRKKIGRNQKYDLDKLKKIKRIEKKKLKKNLEEIQDQIAICAIKGNKSPKKK